MKDIPHFLVELGRELQRMADHHDILHFLQEKFCPHILLSPLLVLSIPWSIECQHPPPLQHPHQAPPVVLLRFSLSAKNNLKTPILYQYHIVHFVEVKDLHTYITKQTDSAIYTNSCFPLSQAAHFLKERIVDPLIVQMKY